MNTVSRRKRARSKAPRRSADQHFHGSLQEIICQVIPETEILRSKVTSEHWRRVTNHQNRDVYWFRTEHLHGDTISARAAKRLFARLSKNEKTARKIERICRSLSHDHGWDMDQALRFLFTGNAPVQLPIELEALPLRYSKWGSAARATISFDLCTSPSTIIRALSRLRHLSQQRAKRPIEEKLIQLAELVSKTMVDPKRRSQRYCMGRWNKRYPQWAYSDERHFARDCKRAKRIVLFMNIAPPELGPGEKHPGTF